MFALHLYVCGASLVSFLLVTKSEIGAERVPIWEASGKCSEGVWISQWLQVSNPLHRTKYRDPQLRGYRA